MHIPADTCAMIIISLDIMIVFFIGIFLLETSSSCENTARQNYPWQATDCLEPQPVLEPQGMSNNTSPKGIKKNKVCNDSRKPPKGILSDVTIPHRAAKHPMRVIVNDSQKEIEMERRKGRSL